MGFTLMGTFVVFILYVFIAGSIAGMFIADNKESLKLASPKEKLLLTLLVVFWPISVLIGMFIKE